MCPPILHKHIKTYFSLENPSIPGRFSEIILYIRGQEYNPIDYGGIELVFGSFEKALAGMEVNCGAEHDLKEDWDDYSVYARLGVAVAKRGIQLQGINFEGMDPTMLADLRAFLKRMTNATEKQLDKYLHMNIF